MKFQKAHSKTNPRNALLAFSFVIFALAACAMLAPAARAQGSRKDDIVFNAQGRPLAGATVRVCTSSPTGQPCTPLANIYSDAALTQALANPLSTDGLGNYTFYAAPGLYEIEISGPGIITKQLPNVILPNDPSTPTFTSLSTTSGISAFSLSLSGNLTVNGSTAVTGTLSVGGAPVPSTGQQNIWSANQHFAGPNPWIDITAMNPPACQYSPFQEIVPNSLGSIAAGSHTLNVVYLNSGLTVGCGIMVHGAGPASTMAAPTAVTIVNHNGTGSTTYKYQVVAIDGNLHGTSPASSVATTATGVATLSKFQYNYIKATVSTSAIAIIIYGDKGLGGALSCLGVSRALDGAGLAAWEDMGFYSGQEPCPSWAPSTPPASAGNQTLITTITAISGTTLTLADAATNAVTNGLYHSDSTAALEAAMTEECAQGPSKIMIPPGGVYALAFMPLAPCGTWHIESYGSLYMSDGLGADFPYAAYWEGNQTQNPQQPGGSGYSASIEGTLDSGAGQPVIDDVVVLLGGSQHVDGLQLPTAFNGISSINGGFMSLTNIFVGGTNVISAEGCGIRLVGQNIGPNVFGPGVMGMAEDTTGVGGICSDQLIAGGGSSLGTGNNHIRDMNFTGHGMYVTCPFGCAVHGDYSMTNTDIRGGLTENQGDNFWGLMDPGTVSEGNTLGMAAITMSDMDGDNDPLIGPCWTILDPPGSSGASISSLQIENNTFCGAATGSVSVAGVADLQPPNINYISQGSDCPDGSNGQWAFVAQQGGAGLVRTRNAGSCMGPYGAGIQSAIGVYQTGDFGNPVHNYNFATLIPPPEFGAASTTTGTLTGTYYYRATSVDCAGRESQPGPEIKATASSQGIVLNYTIGEGVLYGACGVNIYRGTTTQGENLLLAGSSPTTTNLATFTDTGSLSTTSRTLPGSSQAFESELAERGGDFSYLLASQTNNLYQKRMGFGTGTDPGAGSNVKWSFNGRTEFQSGVIVPLATKTTAYTLTINDYWVNVTGTTTITIPHANVGQLWIVFNSGAGTVTLQADSGNINGAASVTLAANTGYNVTCDGTNCFATH